MTTEDQDQTPPVTDDTTVEGAGTETIEETKEALAKMYLNFLDQQKGGVLATGAGFGVSLNPLQKDAIDYLTSDTVTEDKKDIFKTFWNNLKKKAIEKYSGGTMLEYDKASLIRMKALIVENKDNQTKLQELMAQIASGVDPTLVAVAAAPTGVTDNKDKTQESSEEVTDRRQAVVANINAVLEQDKIREDKGEKEGVDYNRGGHTSLEAGLDCGGLIVYCANQAGLKVTGNGRGLFEKFPSKKLEADDKGAITTDVSDFKEGDIIVRDALDPAFYGTDENKGRQHGVTGSEGQVIHPHHFGFIKSIDKEKGLVNTIESNGSNGVTDDTPCNVSYRLDAAKVGTRKSAIRAVHVNYDELEKLSADELAKLEELPGSKLAA